MKILITGSNGFVGTLLVQAAHKAGHTIYGLGRSACKQENKHLITGYSTCDLAIKGEVNTVDFTNYDCIINVAGFANVAKSFGHLDEYMANNTLALENICAIVTSQKAKGRIIAISSGAVYEPTAPVPFTEESPIAAEGSPYALSKIAMEKIAFAYIKRGLDIVIARPFTHIGPGQREGFIVSSLVQQIQSATKEHLQTIQVGNLSTNRDYTDARDVVNAYLALATKPKLHHTVYNICSNIAVSGTEILRIIQDMLHTDYATQQASNLIRPNDPPILKGSYERLNLETDWKPHIPLRDSIRDYIDQIE